MLAPICDVVIVVDVLSFCTSVDIATSRGALVFPFPWDDTTAHQFAESIGAQVADKKNKSGYSLSPSSLQTLPLGSRLVLPSPNGSEICLSTGLTPTIAGCLRNCGAVAESAMRKGVNIGVIPAGERWPDGTLRPCLEDMIGAGALVRNLRGTISPEAEAAAAVFETASRGLLRQIEQSVSGREKLSRGEGADLELAAELNISDCVPLLADGAFLRE